MNTLKLPAPIAHYFESEHNPEALTQCFAADAVMIDDGHTFKGIHAIQAFLAEASAKYGATTVPFAVKDSDGVQVVDAKVTGNFPGSPINLSYRFSLAGDRIAALEVTI
jgi:hypothetical protein